MLLLVRVSVPKLHSEKLWSQCSFMCCAAVCTCSPYVVGCCAGVTPLMTAVRCGKPDAVKELLAMGADAARGDAAGATALHHAAWTGECECLQALLVHTAARDSGSSLPRCTLRMHSALCADEMC
jgi:Ankyrin repeats (3 copies)